MFYLNEEKKKARYDMSRFMEHVDEAETFDIMGSFFIKEVLKLPVFGEYLVTKEEHRPDLISHEVYGSTQYWWVILLYNRIWFFQEIILGMSLAYPSLQNIENLFFRLRALLSAKGFNVIETY